MKGVLFVCLGNICRSPLAQGIFEHYIKKNHLDSVFYADSAGTSSWHQGEKPDDRSISIAQKYGIDITNQRSRPVTLTDKQEFSVFIAMDKQNKTDLIQHFHFPEDKVHLMLDFHPMKKGQDVPDPYHDGKDAFDKVFRMIEESMPNLLEFLRELA